MEPKKQKRQLLPERKQEKGKELKQVVGAGIEGEGGRRTAHTHQIKGWLQSARVQGGGVGASVQSILFTPSLFSVCILHVSSGHHQLATSILLNLPSSWIAPRELQWPDLMCATFQPLSHPTKNQQVPWISDTLPGPPFTFLFQTWVAHLWISTVPHALALSLFYFYFLSFLFRWGCVCMEEHALRVLRGSYFGLSKAPLPFLSPFLNFLFFKLYKSNIAI